MPLHTKAATPLLRWTRHQLPTAVARAPAVVASLQQTRAASSAETHNYQKANEYPGDQFDNPFHRSGGTARETTNIPSFGKYKSTQNEVTNRVFQYFMVGTFGALTAMGAKATVQGL